MTAQLNLASWVEQPLESFLAFIQSDAFKKTAFRERNITTLSKESVTVYKAMFATFLEYLSEQKLTVLSVGPAHIYAFLTRTEAAGNSRPGAPRKPILQSDIQYSYLRLLERTFTHLNRNPRPTDDLLFGPMKEHYKLKGRNQSTVALTEQQIALFMEALPAPAAQERPGRTSANWKKRRDRALQCTLLGAGLTVSEVIALNLDDVDTSLQTDGSLMLTIREALDDDGAETQPEFRSHTTFLQPRFVEQLLPWLSERRTMLKHSSLLFPNHEGMELHKATVYRQIRHTFQRSQISLPRMGGRTLRNTYAVQELKTGTQHEELSSKLGLYEDRSLAIYTEAAKRIR